MTKRALISAIGSLGNGGLVAIFGIFYYPHLPQIGKYIRTLCFAGTFFVGLGMAAAVAAHNVCNIRSNLSGSANMETG